MYYKLILYCFSTINLWNCYCLELTRTVMLNGIKLSKNKIISYFGIHPCYTCVSCFILHLFLGPILFQILISNFATDPRILYETPRRVFTSLPGSTLPVCDYVFVDETPKESRDRFRELLDIDVDEESIDMDCESLPCE